MNTSCLPERVRLQTGCCAIRAKAPVGRVPTNPSLKAGVSDGLIVRLSLRRELRRTLTTKSELGFSPDSACAEPVEVPNLQSVGQVQTTRRAVSTSSAYL